MFGTGTARVSAVFWDRVMWSHARGIQGSVVLFTVLLSTSLVTVALIMLVVILMTNYDDIVTKGRPCQIEVMHCSRGWCAVFDIVKMINCLLIVCGAEADP